MMLSTRYILLLLVTCEVYVSALAELTKMSDNPTSSIVSIMKRLQKKGHVRPRRSYIDNRIDTLPNQPVYFSQRSHDNSQSHDLSDRFHPPYGLDIPHDSGLDILSSLSFEDLLPRGEKSNHQNHKEPLDLASILLGEEDGKDDLDLDFPPLPAKFDFKAPVSERAEKDADILLEDFLTYLDLRASGALNECLKREK